MKKYLDLIIAGLAVLFSVLIFATMSADAVTVTIFNKTDGPSVYEMFTTEGIKASAIAITCLVLTIVSVLASAFVVCSLVLKKFENYRSYISLATAVVLVINGILFFCLATGDYKDFDLGAGAILSAIFSLVAALASGFAGVKALKK